VGIVGVPEENSTGTVWTGPVMAARHVGVGVGRSTVLQLSATSKAGPLGTRNRYNIGSR